MSKLNADIVARTEEALQGLSETAEQGVENGFSKEGADYIGNYFSDRNVHTAMESLNYIITKAEPFSPAQIEAADKAFSVIDDLAARDLAGAVKATRNFLFAAEKAGRARQEAMTGFLKNRKAITGAEYQKALKTAKNFTSVALSQKTMDDDNTHKLNAFINGALAEGLDGAFDAVEKQMRDVGRLSPLGYEALKKYEQLLQRLAQNDPGTAAKELSDFYISKRLAEKYWRNNAVTETVLDLYFKAVSEWAKSDLPAATEALFEAVCRARDEKHPNAKNTVYSALAYEGRDGLFKFLERMIDEDLTLAGTYFKNRLPNSPLAYEHHTRMATNKFDEANMEQKLAVALGLDREAVKESKMSRSRIRREFNRCAFFNWADKNRQNGKTVVIGLSAAFGAAVAAANSESGWGVLVAAIAFAVAGRALGSIALNQGLVYKRNLKTKIVNTLPGTEMEKMEKYYAQKTNSASPAGDKPAAGSLTPGSKSAPSV